MLLDDAATDIPLVVVPPLKGQWVGKKLTEAEVNRFLAERGTDKAPLGDLNNDGRRDYRDDYIMIGNYLLAASPTKGKAAPVPAQQKPTAVPATAATGKQAAPDQK
jgi:hypothetical protein